MKVIFRRFDYYEDKKSWLFIFPSFFQGDRKEKYAIGSVEHDKYDCFADNPVDACYEMIIKLHEQKLL